ncbi:hypothetical protein NQZ79_g486 [Umbelopsis isabellina]|nr:hypothetical protein NQZ79_g486 [Umbelopsis isabellina]
MIRTSVRRITSNARMFKRLQSGGRSEGATVTSKGGISEKEKAAENMWVREQEADKLKALQEALHKQKQATESLQKDIDALKKNAK